MLRQRFSYRIRKIFGHLPINMVKPVRLTIRWGQQDLENSLGFGKKVPLAHFQKLITEFIQVSGPHAVHLIALENADDPDVAAILRFAHRLGCPTEVVLNGRKLQSKTVDALLDSGVDVIWVPIGGLSQENHYAQSKVAIEESNDLLYDLVQRSKETSTQIGIAIPWSGESPNEAAAIRDWSKEIGVSLVQIALPYFGKDMSDHSLPDHKHLSSLLKKVLNDKSTKPGWKRLHPWVCPVGNLRLEISKNGRVCSCPFKTPVLWEKETFGELWKKLEPHRQQVNQCSRVCLHKELRF